MDYMKEFKAIVEKFAIEGDIKSIAPGETVEF